MHCPDARDRHIRSTVSQLGVADQPTVPGRNDTPSQSCCKSCCKSIMARRPVFCTQDCTPVDAGDNAERLVRAGTESGIVRLLHSSYGFKEWQTVCAKKVPTHQPSSICQFLSTYTNLLSSVFISSSEDQSSVRHTCLANNTKSAC